MTLLNAQESVLPDIADDTDIPDTGRSGLVGPRRLVAVQTFDIGRLTTHPVPIVPSSFVAVSGQGPKGDSNGSGKTTFLSAVALLLADPQWRLDSDGRDAAKLLFNPESAGSEGAGSAIDHGYIAGVFARPDDGDPLTVWMRIASRPPYIRVRWTEGLHVAQAATDEERALQGDDLWDQLPGRTLGSRAMSSVLYGDAPRCLAYLDTPMRQTVPSLLSQQMTSMSPEAIGEALIALTGREHLTKDEVKLRRDCDVKEDKLRQLETEDHDSRGVEEAHLAAVARRNQAREALEASKESWTLHLAKGVVEKKQDHDRVAERLKRYRELLEEAEILAKKAREQLRELTKNTNLDGAVSAAEKVHQRLDDAHTEQSQAVGSRRTYVNELVKLRGKLLLAADGDDGVPVGQREHEAEEARMALSTATVRHTQSQTAFQKAQERLELVTAGHDGITGTAIRALDAHGIEAFSVLDAITLTEAVRPIWEAHLWRFRDTVAVPSAEGERVLRLLADQPQMTGVSVVCLPDVSDGHGSSGDIPPLPEGVTAPAALSGFLHAIRDRYVYAHAPDRSHDTDLDEWVLGGFADPVTGRDTRIAAAQHGLDMAEAAMGTAAEAVEHTRLALNQAQERLGTAKAAEALKKCKEDLKVAKQLLAEATVALHACHEKRESAREKLSDAKSERKNHRILVEIARERAKVGDSAVQQQRNQAKNAEAALHDIGYEAWCRSWSPEADTDKAHESAYHRVFQLHPREQPRSSTHWREQSMASFHRAHQAVSPDRESVSDELLPLMKATKMGADAFPDAGADRESFLSVIRPLGDLLDGQRDHDTILKERIDRNRAERERTLHESRKEIEGLSVDLEALRASVADSVKRVLRKISDQFNALDLNRDGGHGARIDYTVQTPAETGTDWKTHVTPKWRRSPHGGFVSYKQPANGAQIKVFAIQLVLAALLADSDIPGRVLVLDELGNSLGDENRKDILEALHRVAVEQRVTILGTCQDSVIHDAVRSCGQVLWFSHRDDQETYNRPTRSWGSDQDGKHVDRTAFWLRSGRSLLD
ncbi:SepF-like predicted cell division protein (DUF552 family) [Nocardiopsis arvandica]|uniref:SepF-like predicted cell division protein (DUF552 family) n=1 Tax=Nocardiopsis sinuspersici TaxID=501010 RepID=A0A7Y9XHG3_9ACTN|nr:hypothetical protein [Nocardiopsis sinuspersici]NYH55748.1 SepF-like predicted cell division protein (DUF552 family) [Nocardiopsis sinuspersici]